MGEQVREAAEVRHEDGVMAVKKPSGLKIARDKNKFTCSWKIQAGGSDSQDMDWYDPLKKTWKNVSVIKSTTSKKTSIDFASFYPNKGKKKLTKVKFRVRGNSKGKKGWSKFAEGELAFKIPSRPSVKEEIDGTNKNAAVFTWSVSTKDTDDKPFVDVEWQAISVTYGDTKTHPKESAWKTPDSKGTGKASGSTTITYAGSADHWITWFRCRSRGLAGTQKDWTYKAHQFGAPNQSTDIVPQPHEDSGGYTVTMGGKVDTSGGSKAIDSIQVQYAITTPGKNLSLPDGFDSWTDAKTIGDNGASFATTVRVGQKLSEDQCLFTRVNTTHDDIVTYGEPKLVSVGRLKAPSGLTVSTNATTYKATVTATNNSDVPDSQLAIVYCPASDPTGRVVGTIPHGSTSATVQCPSWAKESAVGFNVFAYVGDPERPEMVSDSIQDGGSVPTAPTSVTVTPDTTVSGSVTVSWDWTWSDADGAVIAWADHADAWESTDEPETYEVSNLQSPRWNIAGLQTGERWYIRVRLKSGSGDTVTYGPWSETKVIDLSSAPTTPALYLSDATIPADGKTIATWAYTSTDGTAQGYAQICDATVTDTGITYGDIIAEVETASHIAIVPADLGWTAGETHYLCLQVCSKSGRMSDGWSQPVALNIADKLTATITATTLKDVTVTEDSETRTVTSLTALPLTVTVTGAGTGGTTTVAIERAEDYELDRPDESVHTGYEGETVALMSIDGEGAVTIDQSDITGYLDDGATYRIVATVSDALGQSDSTSMDFEVHWAHQAVMPTATVETSNADDVVLITPTRPTGYAEGDVCDIYRLSADRPELIVSGAEFGTKYVDPYPALGKMGGHRVVYKTVNGDYITADNELAWTDYEDGLTKEATIIEFGSNRVELPYNLELSSDWSKDFQETKYLGGSIQGDWNPAVSRTQSINTVVTTDDTDTIQAMRLLATYAGMCHVRTPDGSSFSADVQVSESRSYDTAGRRADFSLKVTRVESETLDGMTYEKWEALR